MGEFGFEIEQDVRYRDLDTMGHVNNAVIATYLERARLEYLREVAELSIEETGFTIANIEIDFRRPVEWQDSVTVGVRVPSVGSTSIPIEYEVRTGGEVAATGGTTLVQVDVETGEPVPIPDGPRERIAEFEGH